MTCETAKILLLFSRPHGSSDLTSEDATALKEHLTSCPHCSTLGQREKQFDQAIATAIRGVTVPNDLSQKLLKEAYSQQGAMLRKKIYAGIGAVAFVFLGGATGYLIHWTTRPNLDNQQLLDGLQADLENPEAASRHWLASQKLPQHLPEPFDFRLLSSRGRVNLQGQQVACLTFQVWRPGEIRADTCKVFLLNREQFKLHNLQEAQNSFGTVRVIPDDGRGWAFVIVHTTNLELFLKPNSRQVG